MKITIKFIVNNVGKSPARRVDIDPKVFTHALVGDPAYDIDAIERGLIAELEQRRQPWGYTIFPGQQITQKYTVQVDAAEVIRITQGTQLMSIMVYGAVVYGFAFDESSHMTTFAFNILRRDRTDPKRERGFVLSRDDGDLGGDDLLLMRVFTFNEHVT